MSGDETPGEPVGEAEDDAKLYVADPDDYAKTRKLKALNDAKSDVRSARSGSPSTGIGQKKKKTAIAYAVASYGHELLPLLEAAEEAGVIDGEDYYARGNRDIRSYILMDGRVETDNGKYERPPERDSMAIYRHLQTLERKLGLGLDLEEDTNDEWEIQT